MQANPNEKLEENFVNLAGEPQVITGKPKNLSTILVQTINFISSQFVPIFRNLIIIAVITTGLLFLLPNYYRSAGSFIPPDSLDDTDLSAGAALMSGGGIDLSKSFGSALGLQDPGALFVTILQSRTISENIINKYNLMDEFGAQYIEDAIKTLANFSTIVSKDGVVDIEVVAKTPELAQNLVNEYLKQLAAITNQLNKKSAQNEREFLEKRLNKVHSELTRNSRKLTKYQINNKLVDIDKQGSALIDSIALLQTQVITAESELSGLKATYTDTSPKVIESVQKINSLKRKLREIKGTTNIGVSTTKKSIAEQSDEDVGLLDIPTKAVDYIELTRDVKTMEQVFELLTKQYELAKLKEAKDKIEIKIIDNGNLPTKLDSPKRLIIVLLVSFISIFFTLFYAYAKNKLAELNKTSPETYSEFMNLKNNIFGTLFFWKKKRPLS